MITTFSIWLTEYTEYDLFQTSCYCGHHGVGMAGFDETAP